MGLLRAMADVVLVGAGTVRAAPTHEWTPRRVHRRSAALYAAWRTGWGSRAHSRRRSSRPRADRSILTHPGLSAPDVPVILATTPAGAERLRAAGPAPERPDRDRRVRRARRRGEPGGSCRLGRGAPGPVRGRPAPHRRPARRRAARRAVPHRRAQLAGRDDATRRLALIEGAAFEPATAPWANCDRSAGAELPLPPISSERNPVSEAPARGHRRARDQRSCQAVADRSGPNRWRVEVRAGGELHSLATHVRRPRSGNSARGVGAGRPRPVARRPLVTWRPDRSRARALTLRG